MSAELFTAAGTIIAVLALLVAYLQLRRTPSLPKLVAEEAPGKREGGNAGAAQRVKQVHHNLRARSRFIGRGQELHRLIEGLASEYPITAIEGLGGMGKTTLATEIAWRLVENTALAKLNFEAIVWTEDHDGRLTLDDVLDAIGSVLELPYIKSAPLSLDRKRDEIEKHLQRARLLLIVDNIDSRTSPEVLEFFERIPSQTCKILTTSREKVVQGAWLVTVGRLTPADGTEYVKQESERLGLRLVVASDEKVMAIYESAGGNPQAIRLTAGQINSGIVTFAEALDNLRNATDGDIFSAIFERSWAKLQARNIHAANALMVLALHPASVSRDAIEAGTDVHDDGLRDAMKGLGDLSLIENATVGPTGTPRFYIHPLTRAFVSRQLAASAGEHAIMESRLLEYYLSFAASYSDTYGATSNVQHLESERTNILLFSAAAHDLARRTGQTRDWLRVIRFADTMAQFLWGRGYWRDRLVLCERAVEAAESLGDRVTLARHQAFIGRIYVWLGNTIRATSHLKACENALNGATEVDRAIAKRLRAQLASASGNYDEARTLLQQVLEVAPITTDDEGRAATLIDLGVLAARRRLFADARVYLEEALRLDEQFRTTEGIAVSLSHLGNAVFELGDFRLARAHYERGLTLAHAVDRLSARGRCELGLAKVCVVERDFDGARRFAGLAGESFGRLGMRDMAEEARLIVASSEGRTTKRAKPPLLQRQAGPETTAVIFDCDDTILATAKSRWSVLISTAADFGVNLDERTIRANWGKPFDQLIRSLVPGLDQDQFISAYRDAMRIHRPEPVPGAVELIRDLWGKGTSLEIVTSSSRDIAVQDLDALGLTSYFDNIYGYEQTQHHKPDPRVLNDPIGGLIARGFEKDQLLYVGDSVRDYRVAVGNSVAFFAVLTGLETRAEFVQAGADGRRVLPGLMQLSRLLRA